MNKVGLFRSIHLKIVLIYVLLILVAMQIIGVYFVRELEDQLMNNFKTSMNERVDLLALNIEEELTRERDEEDPPPEQDIKRLLSDSDSEAVDITEVRVIDNRNRIVGISDASGQGLVGQRTTDQQVQRVLNTGQEEDRIFLDRQTGKRIWMLYKPIIANQEVLGVIHLIAKIETVYEQLGEINNIMASGTAIALGITAILGVVLAQTITRPISDMRKQALAMAKGNFSRKVKVYGDDEIGQLAVTFNSLTKKLQEAQATTE